MRRSRLSYTQHIASILFLGLIGLPIHACSQQSEAEPQSQERQISVDIAIANLTSPGSGTEYIGTTMPIREVSIQAQTQGQLLNLNAEVGDRIQKGQILAQLDNDVLTETVNQARAQREALIAEVASGQGRILEAKTRVEQAKVDLAQAETDLLRLQTSLKAQIESARLELKQAQKDAKRLTDLQKSGVTPQQEAEQAETAALQAQQALLEQEATTQQQLQQAKSTIQSRKQLLKAARAQVSAEQKTAEAETRRTQAQQAILEQAATQQSFSTLKAPISGVVMSRQIEAGSFLQTGQEILTVGDFSQIKVVAQLSEQLLGDLRLGQPIQVRLDAFTGQTFQGKLTRISPLADSTSRLIPVEVVLKNPNQRIGAGLLARISLDQTEDAILTVPETALQKDPNPTEKGKKSRGFSAQRRNQIVFQAGDKAYIFIATSGETPVVRARQVTLGDRMDGQFEIRSGLKPNERYVQRSSRPLQDGMNVKVSALSQSETP